jgi:hypothetical protein
MNAKMPALTVLASVVIMPCGKPLYVFSIAFCSDAADFGPAAVAAPVMRDDPEPVLQLIDC